MSTSATGLGTLSLQLTKARFVSRQGESLLYLASILAYAICSALALTVAGGTWMFYNRWQHPFGLIAEVLAVDPSYENYMTFYFVLAVIACGLLVPSVIGLASSAAVLGARGRERRLAALRLLGVSSGDVTRMSLVDTLIQAGIGAVIGTGLYYATLPLWSNISMQGEALGAHEMWLPWWLLLSVLLGTMEIGVFASWWGLRQVRISPLGVARRSSIPGLKVWRLVAFGVAIAAAAVIGRMLATAQAALPMMIMAVVILLAVWGLNLLGPWVLQTLSRLFAKAPSPSIVWAARRIEANPKATWQRVSGLGLLAFIGGFVALLPMEIRDSKAGSAVTDFVTAARWDFTTGAMITLGIGMVLSAASILITQASAVFERAEQSRALTKMGAPSGYLSRVSWLETLGPLVLALAMAAALGAAMADPLRMIGGTDTSTGLLILAGVLGAGFVLAVGALAAAEPLQRQVLGVQRRRND